LFAPRSKRFEWAFERVLRVLDRDVSDVYPYRVRVLLAEMAVSRSSGLSRKALTRSALLALVSSGHLSADAVTPSR
jgi:hypothetical protein